MDVFYFNQDRHSGSRNFFLAVLISLVLHALLIWLLPTSHASEKLAEPIRITLVPQTPTRIVPPSDVPEAKVEPETTQLSEKNVQVEKETIQRGMPTPPAPQPQIATPPKQTSEKKASSKAPQLRLDPSQLESTLLSSKSNSQTPETLPTDATKLSNQEISQVVRSIQSSQPYSPFRSTFRFNPGNPDLLPDIPDGSITQLNAKANQYAVFVRRVGLQVFGLLRTYSWQQVPRAETYQVRSTSIVKVIMEPNGDLLSAELLDSSGSRVFDNISLRSSKEGAWDKNPPPGALATDGKIHFIFSMQTWSRPSAANPHSEERWIRMQVGLL